jgi:hypothetical protein
MRLQVAKALSWGLVLIGAQASPALGVGFAENQADRVRLFNDDYYDVAFRKADGRILYLYDKTTNQEVSPGNVFGPWVVRFSDGSWLDGANFSPSNANRRFTYVWDNQAQILTFHYEANGYQACDVTIAIQPSDGPEFDATLTIDNRSGMTVELLAFPVQLSFRRNQIEGVYVPTMEGMKLLPSFFDTYEFDSRYPGQMFSDFAFTDLTVGSFAVFMVHDPQAQLLPAFWKLLRDDGYAGGVHKYHHDYDVEVATGQQQTFPTAVISIGSSLAEAMDSYWSRNQHDTMPKLSEKISPALFDKLAGAVLFKRDFLQGSWTFGSFQAFLPTLPARNLLHYVAFWPIGFDENYPDYLPPNASLGTLTELQNLVAYSRAEGNLVMPYTNPTWWDDQGPTLGTLGTGIVARNRNGSLIFETYAGVHDGYVVSPYHPDVIARQDQTRTEFTTTVPCDLMFEDQVGARQFPSYDGNPFAPDPLSYVQGMVELAERSAQSIPIMSEGGFDRLAHHEAGFCLSQTIGWQYWPDSTFTPWPMAPLWAHENMYFSAHNLAGAVMTNTLEDLTYYISVGYSLSVDLSKLGTLFDLDWLFTLDAFQKHLLDDLLGVGMVSYEELSQEGHTRTVFGNGVAVTANLTGSARVAGDHTLAPSGFVAEQDGVVRAGVLTALNGQSLDGSQPHYLIFERSAFRIRVYQPQGADTELTLNRPASWNDPGRIELFGVKEPNLFFAIPVTVQASTLTFDYQNTLGIHEVDYYLLKYCTDTDFDCDGDTDLDDLAIFEDCLAGPTAAPSPTPPRTAANCLAAFDADDDLDVDLRDYGHFVARFTGTD